MCLIDPTRPPTVTASPSARSSERGEPAGDRARELAPAVVERVAGDVQAQRLLLGGELLVAGHLRAGDRGVELGDGVGAAHRAEQRLLARREVEPAAGGLAHRRRERLEHPQARRAGRVERAAADQALERPLVDLRLVDAAAEVPDRLELAALLARGEDRGDGVLPHPLDRRQAEPDLPRRSGHSLGIRISPGPVTAKSGPPDVDVRRQHRQIHLGAGRHVEGHPVLGVHHRAQQRGHVLGRVVRLEVGRVVGQQRVAGGVALVERVVAGRLAEAPEAARHRGRPCRWRCSPR